MNTDRIITILEALTWEFSPATATRVKNGSILNERDVVRALQIAIYQLKREWLAAPRYHPVVNIYEADIREVLKLFEQYDIAPTYSRLAAFFLATHSRSLNDEIRNATDLYGKYSGLYRKSQVMEFFISWLGYNGYSKHGRKKKREHEPWDEVDFFQRVKFHNATEATLQQLKEKVAALGIVKSENLAGYVQKARINYPRSYEPWTPAEDALLWEILKQTNNLKLLSDCFQRGREAIEQRGRKLIYRNGKKEEEEK